MKLSLPILATLAVWTASAIGQPNLNPSTSGSSPANPPIVARSGNPPLNTRNSAVNPLETNRPPARVRVFNPLGSNRWPAPPTRQLPRSPFLQAIGMSLLSDMDAMMDFFERPCGISLSLGMFQSALDLPEASCECRVGRCGFDGIPHPSRSAQSHCPSIATCCCSGNSYTNFAASTVMQNNLLGARSSGRTSNMMGGNTPSISPAGGLNFPQLWYRR